MPRARERSWLIPRLQEELATLPYETVVARCEAAAISWAPVGQPEDLYTDPHLLAGGGLLATAISAMGGGPEVPLPALPLEFGAERGRLPLVRQPPRIGQHGRDVLSEAGFEPRRVDELIQSGALIEA